MLIICSGVLLSLGIISMSTADQGKLLTAKVAKYAHEVMAKNSAHTAIQIAMQKISEDSTWAEFHGSSNPWITTIDDASTELYTEYVNSNHKTNNYWNADSLRIYSKATVAGDHTARVISLYLKRPFGNLVPPFESALTAASGQINPFSAGGSASISGTAPEGSGCVDKPAMTVTSSADSTTFSSELSNITTDGSETVNVDNSLSYQPTDELIDRLSNTDGVTYLNGNYKGEMGTKDRPGVFFMEEPTKLTGGISEGYGIMVVRTNGEMSYEDEEGNSLDIAGNFTFNGLVIFENAYSLNGNGTPTINGSVLIGNTADYTGDIDVSINGNLHLQYDCNGENYAKKAAANAVKQNKYSRVVTFEEMGLASIIN